MRKYYILFVFLLGAQIVVGQATHFPERNGITVNASWIDNLILINTMSDEPLPPEKQMLYKEAEAALACKTHKGFSDLSNNWRFKNYCKEKNIVHLGGPMLGCITDQSVNVWVRTVKPEKVTVKVKINDEYKTFGPVGSFLETDLSAVVPINGLKPNTQYSYRVFVGEQEIDIPSIAMIRTLPVNKETNTRVVFGSCFHRFGLGNMDQAKTIISRNPHAFLGLGDIAAQDRNNSMGWHSLDYLARDLYPAWQNIVANVPFYAIWDDHDYFDNDKAGTPKGYTKQDKENVWSIFRYSWNNPDYGFGDEGKGIFFRTRIGACDVIMLDHRYFRKEGSFLGEKQMKWLKEQLLDCIGPFIILADGTMWSDYVSNGKDSWGVYDTAAREQIFSLIEENNISGVLLISGDRHGSRGFRIPRPSGFNFYEFEVASLGGLGGQPATTPEWKTQFYGKNGGFFFGEFTFDTKPDDPTVTFNLINDQGEIVYEMTLKRSELTPGKF